MKTITQISNEIVTVITDRADGKSRIEMTHVSGESKIAIFSTRNLAGFVSAMHSGLVARIANKVDAS